VEAPFQQLVDMFAKAYEEKLDTMSTM